MNPDRRSLLGLGAGALGATVLPFAACSRAAKAAPIRVALGTQDTTINCATGGLLIRELKLLEKHLPRDGAYKGADYDIQWRNFTSGAPLTNEMVAGKLDFGAMADFPGVFNGAAFEKARRHSLFLNVLCGSLRGSGNGVIVPAGSKVQSLAELKGKTISVPFASTAHGMLLRAVRDLGWTPGRDVTISTQAPEVAGTALRAGTIDAHADFVPFADLYPYRGFARKIFDGSQAATPTFHGSLVDADYAAKHPEIVVAYQKAALEADRLFQQEPEKHSELVAKLTGIEAEVVYLFHGPLGLQTRDLTWKPEYRQALKTAAQTLTLVKGEAVTVDADRFIADSYIRRAFQETGLDYDKALANRERSPLVAKDALTGAPIVLMERVAQVWLKGEPTVRAYASPENALRDLAALEKGGKPARIVYAQDRDTGIKLLASSAAFTLGPDQRVDAFLLPSQAKAFAKVHGGRVTDFAGVRAAIGT
ncbi:MAG: ABC transporter substrate-binding protein [Caulobacteraceae bacterium]